MRGPCRNEPFARIRDELTGTPHVAGEKAIVMGRGSALRWRFRVRDVHGGRSAWSRRGFRIFIKVGLRRNWWNGLPVYTNHRVTIPRYIGPVDPFCLQVEFNAHPPSSVLVMIPWAMLDYRDALLAWNVLSLAMLVASLEIIRRSLELPLTVELIAQMVIFLLFE